MRILLIITLLTLFVDASLLDFSYLKSAKEAYKNEKYEEAEKLYQKVEGNEATFNQADSLYRQKKYQEALKKYQEINSKKLSFKKLHNIGNTYAHLEKIDEAIKSYEEALKIEDDEDTKFNLELLKKKKEQKQKKKDKKEDKDKKDKNQDKKDKQKDNKKSEEENKNKEEQKKESKEKQKEEEAKKQDAKMAEQNQTQPPISNMEERKWQKMLNQRGVNTLMIPLNKGDKQNETNPW